MTERANRNDGSGSWKIDLQSQRILLVAPRFFGYERQIIDEMEKRGADVDWLPDRPFDTPLMTAVTRYSATSIMPFVNRLYRRQLNKWGRRHYDIILVLNGQTLSRTLLAEMRAQYPSAKLILYMWDSVGNRSSVTNKLDLFDVCFSFDPSSVAEYGMQLRPLFFSPQLESSDVLDPRYHISFIGTAHTDRYAIVSRIDAGLPSEVKRFWYLYLQAQWVFSAYKITNRHFNGAKLQDFRFAPLPYSEVGDVFNRSTAVLDIEHPRQMGLTMRTFETLGSCKKLVTTNAHVRDMPFYNPDNILVIDRNKPAIDMDFLNSPYAHVEPDIYQRYSLSGWLDEILVHSV